MKKKTRKLEKLLITLLGSALVSAAVPPLTWAMLTANHNETLVRDSARLRKKKTK